MTILVLKNIEQEGLGTLEGFFKEYKLSYKIIELSLEEKIPDTTSFDSLVMLGGPMSVNDFDTHKYLLDEFKTAKDFIDAGKKVFGICLGAQIIAKVLGSKVYKGHQEEIGWFDIKFTSEAKNDACCQAFLRNDNLETLNQVVPVFHWHGETFNLPEGTALLASSDLYDNQAFSYQNRVYAFQFHIEVTEEIICRWFKNDQKTLNTLKKLNKENYNIYLKRAEAFYKAFFLY